MNKEQAFHILGLPDEATASAISKKFSELYNDYQIRYTNAPTPNLKTLYKKNIEEIQEAYNVLTQVENQGDKSELPLTEPRFSDPIDEPVRPSANTTTVIKTDKNGISGKGNVTSIVNPPEITANSSNLKWILIILLLVSVIACGIFYFQKLNRDAKITELNTKMANPAFARMSNSKFVVRNEGRYDFTITYLMVFYRNSAGEVVCNVYDRSLDKVHEKGYPVPPGKNVPLQLEMTGPDGSTRWDGSVIFFYLCGDTRNNTFDGPDGAILGFWNEKSTDGVLQLKLKEE